MYLVKSEPKAGIGEVIDKLSPQMQRRVPNPVFKRVPNPLPWFVVDVYDSDLDELTLGNKRGPFLYREVLSFQDLVKAWNFKPDFLFNQKPGPIFAGYHQYGTDLWIAVRLYPGFLKLP